jgi:predicted Zn-dependent protease
MRMATIELAWKDNLKRISCIPAGIYKAVREYSHRFNQHLFELIDVDGRSEIKIHVANYSKQLNGCIGVGNKHVDLNGDGILDVTHSKATLNRLHRLIHPDTSLIIEIIDAIK